MKRRFEKYKAERQQETPEQKAARRTATATYWIAGFTIVLAITSGITLYVVIDGGSDTKAIAEAAKTQSAAAVQQMSATAAVALAAKDQADKTGSLADRMKDQADQTKRLAEQARTQSAAAISQSQGLEKMAQSAATQATAALDQSEQMKSQLEATQRQFGFLQAEAIAEQRSWVKPTFTLPGIEDVTKASVSVQNTGKSPSLVNVVNAWYQFFNADTNPVFQATGLHSISDVAIMYPNDRMIETKVSLEGIERISADRLQGLLRGQLYLALWGTINYTDQFGDHWALFCTWRGYSVQPMASYNADACVRFNRVGDGNLLLVPTQTGAGQGQH